MRVVLDTNALLSALLSPHGWPDAIYRAWQKDRFDLTGIPFLAGKLLIAPRQITKAFGEARKRSPDPNNLVAQRSHSRYSVNS
ncbi:hypothetical protein A6M27_17865 [Acidithiobacillus thiooxidans]|uniref:PIN domain-containing protein n=1 Tax=Acidithiobacillus thiooxidans TaxID=930 RepID=A0A1C2I6J2_ACITH|nr:hypothetical protein A6M23_19495 [Acidithiobacillus thiooxidans]OCX71547.1 hypothetical protein A6P07_11755 [Acidithiobacillus thiooxidans]OCX75465.1 hypothetical protein A6O24_09860 [Acidithiobacillus thiooxidans]OCX78703.1 hypothetical protein A6O26_17825 [Acidithiobacillus thiooxidans]OCX80432.1 hypothetical protein A6P08_16110 [Acidithiobacillus thiooxidans]